MRSVTPCARVLIGAALADGGGDGIGAQLDEEGVGRGRRDAGLTGVRLDQPLHRPLEVVEEARLRVGLGVHGEEAGGLKRARGHAAAATVSRPLRSVGDVHGSWEHVEWHPLGRKSRDVLEQAAAMRRQRDAQLPQIIVRELLERRAVALGELAREVGEADLLQQMRDAGDVDVVQRLRRRRRRRRSRSRSSSSSSRSI